MIPVGFDETQRSCFVSELEREKLNQKRNWKQRLAYSDHTC